MKIAEYRERIADTKSMINKADGSNLFDTLIDNTEIWNNDACKGYCILAMEDAGYNREQIREVLRQFSDVFDFVTQDQAEAAYNRFEHGEPTRQRPTEAQEATFKGFRRQGQ